MANSWYTLLLGEQIGPLTDDELREMASDRRITPDDLVRKATSANWVPAARVRGLFQEPSTISTVPASAPPPRPSASENVKGRSQKQSSPTFASVDANDHPHLAACPDCGKQVSMRANSCPHCGHTFFRPSRIVAVLLALVLGSFGAHKFYLRRPGLGVLYLIFFWTYIPGIVGIVEGLQYLFMDDVKFNRLFDTAFDVNSANHRASQVPPVIEPVKDEGSSRRRWLVGVAVTIGVIAAIGMIATDAEQYGNNRSRGGSVNSSGGRSLRRDTPAGITQEAYSRMSDLAIAGDHSGLETLMAAGLSFMLPKGTHFRVIDLGIFTTEIKVESGPFAGRYLIVATDHIN